ncbi:TPA: hypothetical protein MIM79_24250 [Klebsiella variicola]|nr:hypothetical protein [Klebsiella variicola]
MRSTAIREPSPVALTLTGATNRVLDRSTAIREPSPVALTLTGATNRVLDRSTAIREPSPGGAYAYRGYQSGTGP